MVERLPGYVSRAFGLSPDTLAAREDRGRGLVRADAAAMIEEGAIVGAEVQVGANVKQCFVTLNPGDAHRAANVGIPGSGASGSVPGG